MNALTIFIKRPVLATMVTALLLVLGIFSYKKLGVDLMPKVEVPVVTVLTTLRGASPEEVESQITKPIEEAVNTVSGIDELTSINVEGLSRIVVRFLLEKPIDEAVQDVRDKVAAILRLLPTGTDPPVVAKVDIDAFPVMTLTVAGPRDLKEVSEVARLKVKEAIENTAGVGAVNLIGNRKRAVNVVLNLERLKAFGIPIAQVKAALASQNVEIPSGRIEQDSHEQVLRTLARIERVEDFERVVVATRGGRQIQLGDIGRVEDSVEEPRSLARIWNEGDPGLGTPAVSLDVVKQSGTNTVEVIDNVKRRLREIEPLLPQGFRIAIVSDQSTFIVRSIEELRLHLVMGGLLAALAVLIFMRSLRSTLIAAVAIPTSLVATFSLMHALGFSLNNMTLLGLTLAVGVVIDDAIVVLENIYRHMEQYGKSAFQAAVDGLREIGLAVMATTTSLVVIFLPMAFMGGMIGRFFYEFGLTVAFAIGVSLLVSFTLTPMLSSRFLRLKKRLDEHEHGLLARGYGAIVRLALRYRLVTIALSLAIIASAVPIGKRLGRDFMPQDDRSEFQISLIAPAGLSLEGVSALIGRLEAELHTLPGVRRTLTQIGNMQGSEDVTRASIYVAIEDLERRSYSQFDIMKQARALLAHYPEIRGAVNSLSSFAGSSRQAQLQVNLTGPDLDGLSEASEKIARELAKRPGIVDVDTSLAARQPELRVRIDRPKAADLGIAASDLAMSLRTMVGGEIATKFREGVEQYDVWLRLDRTARDDASVIGELPLQSPRIGLVPLSQVATLSDGRGPAEIDRYNRQRVVSIFANLDGIDLGSATRQASEIAAALNLSPAYRVSFMGQSKMMAESMGEMLTAFLLAFIFMYIVLAAQFESFLHPITILLSLPLTLPFALLSLLILHESISIYSLLGVFMLFGIVKKNGILQIDYTNTLRRQGVSLHDAIVEANQTRLRPILMTTMTLIAGMTPIALGQGPGAAARASLAKVIIGGQALSLFITLLIVPVAYSLFEGAKRRLQIGQTDLAAPAGATAAPDESLRPSTAG